MSVISKALEKSRRDSGGAEQDAPPATPASVVLSSKAPRRASQWSGGGFSLPGPAGKKAPIGLLMGGLALAGVVAGYLLGRDAAPVRTAAPPSRMEAGPAGPMMGAPAMAGATTAEPESKPVATPAPQETPITVRVEVSLAQPAPVAGTPIPLPSSEGVLMDEPLEPVVEEWEPEPEEEPEATPEPTPAPVRRRKPEPTLGPPQLSPVEIMSMYRLQGVFFTEGDSSALINGEVVAEGTVMDDIKVLKINKTSVEIEHNGRRYVLK